MQVKKQQLELGMKQWTGSKLGKKNIKAVYRHPAYLTSMQSTSCEMLGWMKHKLESRFLGESEEKLKSLLMKVKNESEKAVLKLNIEKMNHGIQSHHFMANRWGNNGNSDRLYILGLQKSLQMVTAALKLKDACSSKKSYDQPRQHIKKQKHYFANKGPSSQGYGFSSSHEWM